jgi:hypothetical protein
MMNNFFVQYVMRDTVRDTNPIYFNILQYIIYYYCAAGGYYYYYYCGGSPKYIAIYYLTPLLLEQTGALSTKPQSPQPLRGAKGV